MKEFDLDHTKILDLITKFYLESHDFNGYPVYTLRVEHGLSDDEAKEH